MGSAEEEPRYTEEFRDTSEVQLPPSPLKTVMKWLGVLSALGGLVGYGVWIGTIQNRLDTIESDVADNEDAHKANAAKLVSAERNERDRLNKLRDSVVVQFNSDKDELWELKMAMAAVNQRVATYHSGHAYRPPRYPTSMGESAPMKRPMSASAKRKAAAKRADSLIEDVFEEPAEEAPPPMPTF